MFENKEALHYCKLKDGKVEVYKGKASDGTKIIETFDRIKARVEDISLRESEYQGEKIKTWQIRLVDSEGEKAVLSLGYSSGFTRGFFNSLVNADLSAPILIGCYVRVTDKGDFNSTSLIKHGEVVRWKYDNVPQTEKIKVGSKDVIDDSKAIEWMLKVIEEIKAKLPLTHEKAAAVLQEPTPPDFEGEVPTDLPFD